MESDIRNKIEYGIKKVMSILSIDRMPTSKELRESGVVGLDSLIGRNGGLKYWANELDLHSKGKKMKWNDSLIEKCILEVVDGLMLDRMPTKTEIISFYDNYSLANKIERTGGYDLWAEKINFNHSSDKISNDETEEEVRKSILEVMNSLNIERMPTLTEMRLHYGNDCIINKITKNGGFKFWSEVMGLELKDSNTELGERFEDVAYKILSNKGFLVSHMDTLSAFDLMVNDKVRIDVKSSRLHDKKGKPVHKFGIGKKIGTCDLYFAILLDEYDEIDRIFIIPSHEVRKSVLEIYRTGKYDKYINRFDLIEMYDKFYTSVTA